MRPPTLILGLTCLVIVLALGTFAYAVTVQRRAAVEDARNRAGDLATMLAEHAGRLLDATNLAAEQAMALADGRGWDEVAASREDFDRLRALADRFDFIRALWLADATGAARLTSRQFPAPPLNAADRDYFRAAQAGALGPQLSGLLRGHYNKEGNIVLARRIEDAAGQFRGVATAVIPPDYFSGFYRTLGLDNGAEIELAREDQALVLRYPAAEADAAPTDPSQPAQASSDGEQQVGRYRSSTDGAERIGAVRHVRGFPVLVRVGFARDEVLAAWRRAAWLEAGCLAAALVAVLGLGLTAAAGARREQLLAVGLERRVAERTAELREALASKELLLQEVNHRVKNNLQLVSSLLGMQRSRVESAEARRQLDEAQARIRSIAGLHRILYASGSHNTVDMADYLKALAEDLAASFAAEGVPRPIRVEADRLQMPADAAVPLGLIANELITNAVKHAYAMGDEGGVSVRLRVQGERARLEVADGGQGLPASFDLAASKGIGMRLVAGLTRQLRGSFNVADPDGPGARFVVDLPAQALTQAEMA